MKFKRSHPETKQLFYKKQPSLFICLGAQERVSKPRSREEAVAFSNSCFLFLE